MYDSESYAFDRSVKKKYLRKTVWERNLRYGGLDQREELYVFVSDQEERERVKRRNGIWEPFINRAKKENIEIYEQYVQHGIQKQPTGCCKTVDIVVNAEGKKMKKIRYYKKVGKQI